MNQFKLDGLYDEMALEVAREHQVTHLGFDLRPKSFSFIQHYRLLELIEKEFRNTETYYLKFENEQDFIIQKFIDDLEALGRSANGFLGFDKHFVLEFCGQERVPFCESFKRPYYWHYREDTVLADYLGGEWISGMVLPFMTLSALYERGEFEDFAHHLLHQKSQVRRERPLKLILDINWNSDIFPSLFNSLLIDFLSFSINHQVEISYRVLDKEKIHRCLSAYQEQYQKESRTL